MGAKRHLNGSTQEGIYIHTYIHTDGHCNSMTESAQWADSVKKLLVKKNFWSKKKKKNNCKTISGQQISHEILFW